MFCFHVAGRLTCGARKNQRPEDVETELLMLPALLLPPFGSRILFRKRLRSRSTLPGSAGWHGLKPNSRCFEKNSTDPRTVLIQSHGYGNGVAVGDLVFFRYKVQPKSHRLPDRPTRDATSPDVENKICIAAPNLLELLEWIEIIIPIRQFAEFINPLQPCI